MRIGRSNSRRLLRWASALLVLIGVACLSLFAWYQFEAHYYQASLSREFDQEREHEAQMEHKTAIEQKALEKTDKYAQPFEAGAPDIEPETPIVKEKEAAVTPGTTEFAKEVLGRLEIPSVGLNVMVLRGTGNATLRRGAGWLPDSAEPGKGNVAIAAHRDTHFRPLREIHQGDLVELTTLDRQYNYRVDWTAVVDPENTQVLTPTDDSTITLITCYPFYYVGHAPRRFVVRAVQVGT